MHQYFAYLSGQSDLVVAAAPSMLTHQCFSPSALAGNDSLQYVLMISLRPLEELKFKCWLHAIDAQGAGIGQR